MKRLGFNASRRLIFLSVVMMLMLLVISVPVMAYSILTSPVGGEEWYKGSTHDITWNPVSAPLLGSNSIELEYSSDGGAHWTTLADNLDVSTGKYTWTLPNTTTDHAKVRLTYTEIKGFPSFDTDKTVETSGEFKIYEFQMVTSKVAAPTDLKATAATFSKINLTWKDNSNKETSFNIERKKEGGSFEVVKNVAANTTTYEDTGLSAGTTYTYRIKALGTFIIKDSDYSNEDSAKTPSLTIMPLDPNLPFKPLTTVMKFYIGSADYYVGDELKSMDTVPIIVEGRTLLPIRYVATPLGADVGWDGNAQKVTITFKGKVIELWINQNSASVDGTYILIDPNNPAVTPIISNGRTMLPLRFITEQLGCKVDWDQPQQMVTVTYPKP